jgi:hypothetical protein
MALRPDLEALKRFDVHYVACQGKTYERYEDDNGNKTFRDTAITVIRRYQMIAKFEEISHALDNSDDRWKEEGVNDRVCYDEPPFELPNPIPSDWWYQLTDDQLDVASAIDHVPRNARGWMSGSREAAWHD